MRRLNLNPNELVFGSEVRPQPPHCDKNSYILNHLLSSVTTIIKYKGKSVKWFLLTSRPRKYQISTHKNLPGMFEAEEIGQLAIVIAIMNHEVC